ncbi:leucine-rich repeat-containing protein 19-like [Gouania willdenowi]|uniref:leucine-rich repeat-containing protein 19-like n=1 Tax=Gouania willdenowi TaxID=441366 RepID=UPI00105547A6|nr:leucine-rich repeat-containing protein 19 [Gouania willdenowi]
MMEKHLLNFLFLSVLLLELEPVIGNTTDTGEQNQPMVINQTNDLLRSIPFNTNNSMVTKLVLNGNQITLTGLDKRVLSSYPTLEELHLDQNLVSEVPEKFFTMVKKLRLLSLSRNNISRLHPQAFYGLEHLTMLDLSHNKLTCLPAELNETFNDLQMLNLRGNPWNCSCASLQRFEGLKLLCESPLDVQLTPPPSVALIHISDPPGLNLSTSEDQTPERSSKTWRFTASVAVLALVTCLIIVFAIKGPSWYKLFHDYRHQRLHGDEEPTVRPTTQTFRFNDQRQEREEEEEEGYYEDPYIQSLG